MELLKNNPNVKIDIISADLDFLQLVEDTNNITIYDMNLTTGKEVKLNY